MCVSAAGCARMCGTSSKKQCGKPNDKPSSLISPSMGCNHHVEILGSSLACPH